MGNKIKREVIKLALMYEFFSVVGKKNKNKNGGVN